MDFPPGFMDEIRRYQKEPSTRPKERRIDLEIFSGLFNEVTKVMLLNVFLKKLSACKTDDEKVDVIKPFFKWTPDSSPNTKSKKSTKTCLAFCIRLKEATTMTERMKMVNMMFAFAEDEGDLALANFMRSLYFNQRGDYTGALQAIKNVVKSPVPPKNNLLLRIPSREDLIAMETAAEKKVKASASTSSAEKKGAYKKEVDERKKFIRNLFTVKNSNPVAPSLEDFVEIKSNSSHGRFLVVNKDIPIGTTVLVEKPAVAAPFQEPFNLGVVHCHHCFKKNFNLIPCPNCVFALFCDDKCMKEAENYHEFECSAFPDIHSIVMGLYSTFVNGSTMPASWIPVFKLISSLGPNRLFQIFQEEKNQKNDPTKSQESNKIAGFDPVTKIYDPKSYETICHLHRYFIKGNLFPTVAALCLVKILEVKCNFFENLDSNVDSKTKIEFQDFLTKRMLYHFESFRRNSFQRDEVDSLEGIRLQETKRRENPVELPKITMQLLGPTIYPTASLFSHSCDPNVTRFVNSSHGEAAFVTLRPLKKGEELYVSYGPHYSSEGKEGRQESLDFYNFKCDCVACAENWPTTEEQMMKMMTMMARMNMGIAPCPPFCCPRCYDDLKTKGEGNALAEMKKRKMDWSKISLKPENGFKCANCNKKYSQGALTNEYFSHHMNFPKVGSLLSKNKPLEAIDLVKKASEFYQTKMIPPVPSAAGCLDSFEKAVLNIVHFSPEY